VVVENAGIRGDTKADGRTRARPPPSHKGPKKMQSRRDL